VEEDQVLVDNNMRREWEAAKNEKERTEALVATSKSALEDLSCIIDGSMVELAQSAEELCSPITLRELFGTLGEGNLASGTAVQGNGGEGSWSGAVDKGAK
jgi:hypothetical protein